MKKILTMVLVISVISVFLSGCGFSFNGSYHSVEPYSQDADSLKADRAVVSTYVELRDSLTSLVEDGVQRGVIHTEGISPQELDYFMTTAVWYAHNNTPVGAYALNDIEYEIGTNAGLPAISINISYYHNRSEILRIQKTKNMDEAIKLIIRSLENCDASTVVRVTDYDDRDLTQVIQDYVDANPWSCMEMPQVNVVTHPNNGKDRVLEISFSYQTSRDVLREMQNTVKNIFASAELYVRGDAQNWEKYAQLYSFLMERFDYSEGTSITPAYSLLRHGVGDSKAFAYVYAAMCQQAGLECQVISGTRDGKPWYWNLISDGNDQYHLDLVRCSELGGFLPRLTWQIQGYVWDYTAYGMDPSALNPTNPEESTDPSASDESIDSTIPEESVIPETEPTDTIAPTESVAQTESTETTTGETSVSVS